MKKPNDLQRLMNRPSVPDDLEHKIRLNWHDQLLNRDAKPDKYLPLAAGLFGLLICFALLGYFTPQPDLVGAAVADIKKEDTHRFGTQLPFDEFIKRVRVNRPPEAMPLLMAKYCNLKGETAMHLQVAGPGHGQVHLFIREGLFSLPVSGEAGTADAMSWKLIQPRQNLSVLVLYTKDINSLNVDKLIQSMFYV